MQQIDESRRNCPTKNHFLRGSKVLKQGLYLTKSGRSKVCFALKWFMNVGPCIKLSSNRVSATERVAGVKEPYSTCLHVYNLLHDIQYEHNAVKMGEIASHP